MYTWVLRDLSLLPSFLIVKWIIHQHIWKSPHSHSLSLLLAIFFFNLPQLTVQTKKNFRLGQNLKIIPTLGRISLEKSPNSYAGKTSSSIRLINLSQSSYCFLGQRVIFPQEVSHNIKCLPNYCHVQYVPEIKVSDVFPHKSLSIFILFSWMIVCV